MHGGGEHVFLLPELVVLESKQERTGIRAIGQLLSVGDSGVISVGVSKEEVGGGISTGGDNTLSGSARLDETCASSTETQDCAVVVDGREAATSCEVAVGWPGPCGLAAGGSGSLSENALWIGTGVAICGPLVGVELSEDLE